MGEASSNLSDYISKSKRGDGMEQKGEELFIGTAESEHIEMYLKAIWYLFEKGQDAKVSSIAMSHNHLLYRCYGSYTIQTLSITLKLRLHLPKVVEKLESR